MPGLNFVFSLFSSGWTAFAERPKLWVGMVVFWSLGLHLVVWIPFFLQSYIGAGTLGFGLQSLATATAEALATALILAFYSITKFPITTLGFGLMMAGACGGIRLVKGRGQ